VQQIMALRLAVILCHARRDPDISEIQVRCDIPRRITRLTVSSAWAEQWPQSAHLLREETVAWQKTGWGFHTDTI
jgi:exopolyphosphatase/guanosine-5'-triphosphate,3'-diphosphate pyrophosphatase